MSTPKTRDHIKAIRDMALRLRKESTGIYMSEFNLNLTKEKVGWRRIYQLKDPFELTALLGDSAIFHVVIPAGYKTDLATVPRMLTIAFPIDEMAEAAVIHDFLLDSGIDRFICDAVFRAVIAMLGHHRWKQTAYYYGVRAGSLFSRRKR